MCIPYRALSYSANACALHLPNAGTIHVASVCSGVDPIRSPLLHIRSRSHPSRTPTLRVLATTSGVHRPTRVPLHSIPRTRETASLRRHFIAPRRRPYTVRQIEHVLSPPLIRGAYHGASHAIQHVGDQRHGAIGHSPPHSRALHTRHLTSTRDNTISYPAFRVRPSCRIDCGYTVPP